MYKQTDKMCDLMAREEEAIQIISRFGLSMGVGEQTIDEVCQAHGLHTPTFLAVVNHKLFRQKPVVEDIDLQTLQKYLRQAHTYFLDYRLPRLRQAMTEAINAADESDRIPTLILRCFDEFVQEIRIHIDHENAGMYEEHEHDDQRISDKLAEIKKLIIKYYPSDDANGNGENISYRLISAMSDLWHAELDFSDHCDIEDDILRPALAIQSETRHRHSAQKEETEELSDRERDVLIELVRGRSNKEIADVLCISTHTVITHRKNISRKLNIHSTAGLTIYAIVIKLVDIKELNGC